MEGLKEELIPHISKLSQRSQDIIRLLYGLDDGKPRTLAAVGQLFGVTTERIRQLRDKAIRRLNEYSSYCKKPFLDYYKTYQKIGRIKKFIEITCDSCKGCSSPLNKSNSQCRLADIYKIIEGKI